jgi:hypothetical protein
MHIEYLILSFLLGILAGGSAVTMYRENQSLHRRVRDLEARLNRPGSVPFLVREELEHTAADLILLLDDWDFKREVVQNALEHVRKARGNGRVRP